jgi:predicted cupin superfamily sugar epimerase
MENQALNEVLMDVNNIPLDTIPSMTVGDVLDKTERFPDANREADQLIQKLKMVPTGIGGYLAHGSESDLILLNEALPERFDGDRKAYSTNYFLLKAGEILKIHALNQDEQWFFHQGSAIKLHVFSEEGVYSTVTFGSDIDQGQLLQGIAPHNHWFGAELLGPGYGLASCSLAPAWDKRDSFLPTPEQIEALKRTFPDQLAIINLLQ